MKKNLTRAAAGLGAGVLVGTLGITAVNALWVDQENVGFSLSAPHAQLMLTTDTGDSSVISTDGTVNDSVTAEAVAPEHFTTLANEHRVAVPITITGTTYGKIGLDAWTAVLDDQLREVAEGESARLVGDGPLLSQLTQSSRIVLVESPDECTTDLLSTPRPQTPFQMLDTAANEDAAKDAGYHPGELALGQDSTRADTLCVLLEVPSMVGEAGEHENTVTATGTGDVHGNEASGSDTLNVQIVQVDADYTDALAGQAEQGPVQVTVNLSEVDGDSPFNPGNFVHTDFIAAG